LVVRRADRGVQILVIFARDSKDFACCSARDFNDVFASFIAAAVAAVLVSIRERTVACWFPSRSASNPKTTLRMISSDDDFGLADHPPKNFIFDSPQFFLALAEDDHMSDVSPEGC
jgi:hypothetical protein